MLCAFIFAYMFIIFVRFFFKLRFHVTDKNKSYEPGTDFMEVEATSFQFYITMAAPVFVTLFQMYVNDTFEMIEDSNYTEMMST